MLLGSVAPAHPPVDTNWGVEFVWDTALLGLCRHSKHGDRRKHGYQKWLSFGLKLSSQTPLEATYTPEVLPRSTTVRTVGMQTKSKIQSDVDADGGRQCTAWFVASTSASRTIKRHILLQPRSAVACSPGASPGFTSQEVGGREGERLQHNLSPLWGLQNLPHQAPG